jgi:hypothetical protein
MRLVINKGISGLGNRLRCVAAAIEYAKKTNRSVYVDWTDGMFAAKGENAFNKYFRIVDYPHITSFEEANCVTFYPSVYAQLPKSGDIYDYFERKQMDNRYVRKVFHYMFEGLHKIGAKHPYFDEQVAKMSHYYQCFILKQDLQKQFDDIGLLTYGSHLNMNIDADAVLYVSNIPFYSPDTMRQHIALQPWIEEEINTFVNKYLDNNTVSVHIRTSGKKCFGDTQIFVKKLKIFCKRECIKKVFLSTDNNDVEKLFRKEFSEMLITQDKFIPEIREGEVGIHDYARNCGNEALKERLTFEAVVDMFIMTRTKHLFYQFGSTFSEISKVYQQPEMNVKCWMNL